MSHAHGHSSGDADPVRPLALTFGLVAVFLVVEVVGAFVTNSLALLSDAGHMLTDGVGLGMALAAVAAARRPATAQRSFGLYRLQIVAALVNPTADSVRAMINARPQHQLTAELLDPQAYLSAITLDRREHPAGMEAGRTMEPSTQKPCGKEKLAGACLPLGCAVEQSTDRHDGN